MFVSARGRGKNVNFIFTPVSSLRSADTIHFIAATQSWSFISEFEFQLHITVTQKKARALGEWSTYWSKSVDLNVNLMSHLQSP